MLNRLYQFAFFCILFFTFSCSSSKKDEIEESYDFILKVDVNKIQNNVDFASILCSTDTIVLQESTTTLVGEIDKVILADNYIFILDRKKAREVFMYNTDGSFIRSIGNIGEGAGEYLSPDGLCIDDEKKEIFILDKNNRTFVVYDFEGAFIRSMSYNGFINDFSLYDQDKLIIDNGNMPDGSTHRLTIIDKQTAEVENKLFPIDVTLQNMPFMSLYPLRAIEDRVIYQPSMSSSVYEIYNDNIHPKYKIDFGKYWPKREALEGFMNSHPQEIMMELSKNYVLFPGLLETDETFFVNFSYKGDMFLFFQNKKDTHQKLFIWDRDSDLSVPLGVVNNKFISVKYSATSSPILLLYNIKL